VIEQLIDFARCTALGDARDLVAHLRKHYRCHATTDWDAVAADAAALIAELRRRSLTEIEVSAVVGHLFALARKHRIRPKPELTLVLLGMVTIEGLAKRLDPTVNMMTEVAAYLGPRVEHGRRLARAAAGPTPRQSQRAAAHRAGCAAGHLAAWDREVQLDRASDGAGVLVDRQQAVRRGGPVTRPGRVELFDDRTRGETP
jgi:hypothetical protein